MLEKIQGAIYTLDKLRCTGQVAPVDNLGDALNLAIDALMVYDKYKLLRDLNTPKKPFDEFSFGIPTCPTCRQMIGNGSRFCSECGQAIADEAVHKFF